MDIPTSFISIIIFFNGPLNRRWWDFKTAEVDAKFAPVYVAQ
jgi:hypothetical protein